MKLEGVVARMDTGKVSVGPFIGDLHLYWLVK